MQAHASQPWGSAYPKGPAAETPAPYWKEKLNPSSLRSAEHSRIGLVCVSQLKNSHNSANRNGSGLVAGLQTAMAACELPSEGTEGTQTGRHCTPTTALGQIVLIRNISDLASNLLFSIRLGHFL